MQEKNNNKTTKYRKLVFFDKLFQIHQGQGIFYFLVKKNLQYHVREISRHVKATRSLKKFLAVIRL